MNPGADAPLEGIRVLDLTRLLPGPVCTLYLADLGADVVKIEDPTVGDYVRQIPPLRGGVGARYLAVNRGKRSLALDLKSAAGKAELQQGRVEQIAGIVAGERPSGAIGAAQTGSQPARSRVVAMCLIRVRQGG